jgi:hypothetical protein
MKNRTERNFFKSIGKTAGSLARNVESAAQTADAQVAEMQRERPEHGRDDFEESDLSVWKVFLVGLGVLIGSLLALIISSLWGSYLQYHRVQSSPPPLPIEAHGNPLPPEPRLQPHPREDLKALRAREAWELNTYRWIDPSKGEIAIPIDRATEILAQRGIPPQKAPPGLVLSQPQAGTRETGFEGKVEPEPQ